MAKKVRCTFCRLSARNHNTEGMHFIHLLAAVITRPPEFYSRLRRSLLAAWRLRRLASLLGAAARPSCNYRSSGRSFVSVRQVSLPPSSGRSLSSVRQVSLSGCFVILSLPHAYMNDLDIYLDGNTPWVDMSACVKFGLDRPSRLAGHTEHRYRQTNRQNITPFII